MSGQPERCYAVEELKSLQSSIADLTQSMVIQRARVEKYKDTDLAAAQDNSFLLQATRRNLVRAINSARLPLMETEEYQTAKMAAILQAGLLRFDLMSNVYRPVYDAIQDFIKKFPVDGTTNAAVIGRLMNNVRLGYYPTDPDNISLILRGIQFPEEVTTNLLDPCCGCGKALQQLAQGDHCYAYGVELDESRAEEAQTRLHRIAVGSFFFSRMSHEAFHVLFLNPPYLSVMGEGGTRARHEKRFLVESMEKLVMGGLLVYIIPYYRLTSDIARILCDNFTDISVWKFTGKEFDRFHQIALFGIRKERRNAFDQVPTLMAACVSSDKIPPLTELPEGCYPLPPRPLEVPVFKGTVFNQLELARQLAASPSISKRLESSPLDSYERRPLLPLNVGQVGLIGGSGLINGLVRCDSPHIVKGRITKETVVEITSVQKDEHGQQVSREQSETVTNKLTFNILIAAGFRSLTQEKGG